MNTEQNFDRSTSPAIEAMQCYMPCLSHGSLFSGIGGFDLAAQWMGWTNVFQCEKDDWCRKVLAKNFPKTERFADIKEFDATKYYGTIDVISGGFPCQPFSKAGNKSGREHDDYIWHEMLRIITEVRPKVVVGENVANIVNMGLEEMLTDLEKEGYQIELFNIPAISIGASHQRERLWIVAYNDKFGLQALQQKRVQEIYREQQNECLQIEELFRLDREQGWVYQPPVCGVNDGIPQELDKHRLKALGNAIVPQVAYEIFSAIGTVARHGI